MKLLRDVTQYCIKVDYFIWNEETDTEGREPLYWCIQEKTNLVIFRESINSELRVFDKYYEAREYLEAHQTGFNICYENPRIVEIKYNFEENRWEEC